MAKLIQICIAPNDHKWSGALMGLGDDGQIYRKCSTASSKWVLWRCGLEPVETDLTEVFDKLGRYRAMLAEVRDKLESNRNRSPGVYFPGQEALLTKVRAVLRPRAGDGHVIPSRGGK